MKIIKLPYTKDLTVKFNNIHNLPFSIWLDSGDSKLYSQDYDILSSLPYKTLISDISSTVENNYQYNNEFIPKIINSKKYQHTEYNPISLVNNFLKDIRTEKKLNIDNIPFWHGAMGFFGYDLNQLQYKQLKINKSKTNIPLMAIGFYSWALISDHKAKISYISYDPAYITNDALSKILQIFTKSAYENLINQDIDIKIAIENHFQENKFITPVCFEHYQSHFNTIKNHIKNGNCYQINYTIPFYCKNLKNHNIDSWQIYQYLKLLNKNPFGCYFRISNNQAILSFSPERFIKINNNQIITQPIKGSIPRYKNPDHDMVAKQDLINSEKDRAENIMITDLLRNDLNKHCVAGSVLTTDICKVESYPTIHHLVSTIIGQIKPNLDSLEVFKGCFPGGSITGTPKISAMKIIQDIENEDNYLHRYLYCGNLGYINIDGNLDTNICIRTAFQDNEGFMYWAGSGIVADSECQQEYAEILAKLIKT